MAAPHAALLLESVKIRNLIQQLLMAGDVVLAGEKPLESAAVAEHPQLLFGCAVGRRQHENQYAEAVANIPGAESADFFQNQRAACRGQVQLLAVRMVAVLERIERLVVDLRGGHNPQHEAGLLAAVVGIDQINDFCGEKRLAAACGNLQAERGERFVKPISTRHVRTR